MDWEPTLGAPNRLADRISTHVEHLCRHADRHPGEQANREATAYVTAVMREIGLQVSELPVVVPEWRRGEASMRMSGTQVAMRPGPYSLAADGTGQLLAATSLEEIEAGGFEGAVLLIHGELASVQFTPRAYPWYSDPGHARILEALEAAAPLAVIAATDKNPAMTAGQSPFPLIEEIGFAVPSAYLHASAVETLLPHLGKPARVTIDSEVFPSHGVQPVGVLEGASSGRIVIAAHVDTKPGAPGALDNASGVGVLLATAELLATRTLPYSMEFVPFNGEDHVSSAGELAYLESRPDLSDIALMINIDGAGLPAGPSAYSLYETDERLTRLTADLADEYPHIAQGPQWPSSDHMVFVMRGVPCMAITSSDMQTALGEVAHTATDRPESLDYDLLGETARFIAGIASSVRPQANSPGPVRK